MKDLLAQKVNISEICFHLSSNRFVIKQDLHVHIEEMLNVREILKGEFSKIKNVFVDKKLSWEEIEQLKHFLSNIISKFYKKEWESTYLIIKEFIESLEEIFKKIEYAVDVETSHLTGRVSTRSNFIYCIDGLKFYSFIVSSSRIIDFDNAQRLLTDKTNGFEMKIIKILNLVGTLAEISQISPIISPELVLELNSLKKGLEEAISKLPSQELVDLSSKTYNSLIKFLEDEKLEKDIFPVESFWTGMKKGVPQLYKSFRSLEKIFLD